MVRAVLFDLDDTLVHRRQSLLRYVDRLCRDLTEVTLHIPREELTELVVRTDNGGYLKPGSGNLRVREAVSEAIVLRLEGRCSLSRTVIEDHWKQFFPRSAVAMPGAGRLLQDLSARGIRLAVVSNGSQRSRELTVSSLPFAKLIERVYSSGLIGVKKPDRRIFEHVLADLGLESSDVWFVGDHPVNDIVGATALGIRTVWLEGFHRWPQDHQFAGASVLSLDQVLSELML